MNRGFAYREQIDGHAEGQSVLTHLTRRYAHSSDDCWRRRLSVGEVQLRDRTASADDVLRRGDWLVWHRPPWTEPEVPLSFEVLYDDGDLLAVSKPSGLPTMPAGGYLEHTLLALVEKVAPGVAPMHRLGRGTSGIVLFARTAESRRHLQAAWREHRVEKVYRTLASGRPSAREFVVEHPIGETPHPTLGNVFAVTPVGKRSRSEVRVVEQRADTFLADVRIETGRPHQIRIHLAAVGHPLVGDPLYVAGGVAATSALPGDGGYWLHARLLKLTHPRTKQLLVIECGPPAILR